MATKSPNLSSSERAVRSSSLPWARLFLAQLPLCPHQAPGNILSRPPGPHNPHSLGPLSPTLGWALRYCPPVSRPLLLADHQGLACSSLDLPPYHDTFQVLLILALQCATGLSMTVPTVPLRCSPTWALRHLFFPSSSTLCSKVKNKIKTELNVVVHAYNPSIWEAGGLS